MILVLDDPAGGNGVSQKQKVIFIVFSTLQAILMSMCLQGMVEELIMKKQGKKIKKVTSAL